MSKKDNSAEMQIAALVIGVFVYFFAGFFFIINRFSIATFFIYFIILVALVLFLAAKLVVYARNKGYVSASITTKPATSGSKKVRTIIACGECGAEISEGDTFCQECGAAL